jgi:hypothetical protein
LVAPSIPIGANGDGYQQPGETNPMAIWLRPRRSSSGASAASIDGSGYETPSIAELIADPFAMADLPWGPVADPP